MSADRKTGPTFLGIPHETHSELAQTISDIYDLPHPLTDLLNRPSPTEVPIIDEKTEKLVTDQSRLVIAEVANNLRVDGEVFSLDLNETLRDSLMSSAQQIRQNPTAFCESVVWVYHDIFVSPEEYRHRDRVDQGVIKSHLLAIFNSKLKGRTHQQTMSEAITSEAQQLSTEILTPAASSLTDPGYYRSPDTHAFVKKMNVATVLWVHLLGSNESVLANNSSFRWEDDAGWMPTN